MRFLTALRLGLRRTHRRPGLIVLAWLAALLPAVLLSSLIYSGSLDAMGQSLFAEQALSGNRFGVWTDFANSDQAGLPTFGAGALLRVLLVLLVQTLVSAGIVETLLGASPRALRPFLLGIGRHGWRFLRSALWFLLSVALLAVVFVVCWVALGKISEEMSNGTLRLWGSLGALLVTVLVFAFLDLAYDLSRISGAAHYDPRTLKGYLLALGHSFKRAPVLLPMWLIFVGGGLASQILYLAIRARWSPAGGAEVLLLLLVGQLLHFFRAYLRVGLWASELTYYQGIGEPRWSIRGRRPQPAPLLAPIGPIEQPDTEPILAAPPITARESAESGGAG